MTQSTRFTVGTHILTSLALRDQLHTSEELAWSIGTNASMVRRILSGLNRAGLVVSQGGAAGGVRIAKDPTKISLLEVFDAVELKPSIASHRPNPKCPLGSVLGTPLACVLEEADQGFRAVLQNKTVADVSDQARKAIIKKDRARKRRSAAK